MALTTAVWAWSGPLGQSLGGGSERSLHLPPTTAREPTPWQPTLMSTSQSLFRAVRLPGCAASVRYQTLLLLGCIFLG